MPQTSPNRLSLRLSRIESPPSLLDEARRALEASTALVLFGPGRRSAFIGRDVVAAYDGHGSAQRMRQALSEAHTQGDPSLAPVGGWGRAFFSRTPSGPDWRGFAEATGFVFARTVFVNDGVAIEQLVEAPPLKSIEVDENEAHEPMSKAQYRQNVAAAVSAIADRSLSKVVCARTDRLDLSRPLDSTRLLDALLESASDTTIFVLRWAGATFFGSTPEMLVSVRGGDVKTMALAGSRDVRSTAVVGSLEADLLADPKERAEHAFVVDGIRDALAPLAELEAPAAAPQVVRARHVVHLRTPIRARVRDGVDPLAMIDALHPTPALGGTPRAAALEFIDRHEGDMRGWYGSPLGWIDAAGGLELCVTLRSALVRDRHAVLYAGAGVVEGSNPEGELIETEAKLTAMREVLSQIDGE